MTRTRLAQAAAAAEMSCMTRLLCIAALALTSALPVRAASEPVFASYTVYFSGFRVAELDASLALSPDRYRAVARLRTAGLLATFVRGEQVSEVEGKVAPASAVGLAPDRYAMEGRWRDRVRRITMRWNGNAPEVLTLIPANHEEREPVPANLQYGTVDTMSALAALIARVSAIGECEGAVAVFDGRRRSDFTAATEGEDILAPHRWGIYAGPALRCRFEGRQVAGFWREADPAQARESRTGTAWLARPAPDLPAIPVRIDSDTNWGTIHIHLTRVGRAEVAMPLRETRN